VRRKDPTATGRRPARVPLARLNDDPFVKGISNNPREQKQFLRRLGIGSRPRTADGIVWDELDRVDREQSSRRSQSRLMANGEPVNRCGRTYHFPDEPAGHRFAMRRSTQRS
jgi:hypothetical protein